MQKSSKNTWVTATYQSQSPEKTNFRLKQLEREIFQYKEQLSVKNQQIQFLNQKNSQLIQGKLTTSMKQTDNIYQSSLEKQIQRLNLKIMDKTKQCERLHQKCTTLQNEMTILQDFASDLDRQRKFLSDKLANIQIHTQGDEVVGQLQNKLVLMSTQIMRLGQLNRTKNQQNSDLKFKLKERDQQKQILENEISEKQKIIVQYRQKIRTIQRKIHQMQLNKQYENESTYKILSTQIQRLNIQLNNKMQQINTLQHKNKVLQNKQIALSSSNIRTNNYGQLEVQIQRLTKINSTNKQQISQLQTTLKKIKKQHTQISQANQKYKRNVKKLQQQLQQKNKNYIKDQNEKIKIEIQTHQKINRQQKSIIQKLQIQKQKQFEQRQIQIRKKFQQQTSNMKILLQQSQTKCSSLYADLRKYQEKLVMLSQQVERLSSQNTKYQQQNAQLKRLQYRIQAKERQLKQIIRNRESTQMEIKRDKQTLDRLRIQIRDISQKNKQLQSKQYKLISISNQLEVINTKFISKQKQCKLLQQKLQEQTQQRANLYRIKDLQTQLQSQKKAYRTKQEESTQYYEKQIQNLKQFISKLQLRVRDLSSQQSASESNYIILADEIKRLNQVLSNSSQTIITQKREIGLLQNNLITSQRSIQKIKLFHTPNQKLQQQIKNRTQIYIKQSKIHQQQNISLKKKIDELIRSQSHFQQQKYTHQYTIQNLKQSLRSKQQQLKNLLQDLNKNKQTQDYLITLVKQIKQSNIRLQKKLAQIQQDYIKRLQEKSNQKNQLQHQYIQYNRKIRQIQLENNDLKFQLSSLKNKLQIAAKKQKQLLQQNHRLQNYYNKQSIQKNQFIKLSNNQLKNKLIQYEQQIKNNSKYIGQIQSKYNSKCQQFIKVQNTLKQLQNQKYRIQNLNKSNEQQKKIEYQLKSQQYRMLTQRKQHQLSNIKEQIQQLKEHLQNKEKAIQQKSQIVRDYESKLVMLSQQLQRINTLIYQKNSKIQQLQLQLATNQKSTTKQNKNTMQIFSAQIGRLNLILCQNLQQIKQLQQQVNNKNRQIKRIAQFNKKNQQLFKDKIFQLQQQNHKLNATIGILTKKIDNTQKTQKQYQQLKSTIIQLNSEKTKLKNIITDLQSEIGTLKYSYENNLQQQHTSLNSKATLKVSQVQEIKRQLQRKVSMLVTQNQQLVSQIQKLRRQLQINDQQNTKNQKQLIRMSNENINLSRQKQKYRIINQEILNKVQHLTISKTTNMTMENTQKQIYQYRLRQLQGITKQYQNQIKMTKVQMEKSSKKDANNSATSINLRPSSKGFPNQLQQKYNILESRYLELRKEADGLREKVTEYQFKMKKLRGQFDVINKLTHQYKDQNQYLRQQNHSQCVYVGKVMQNQAVSTPSSVIRQDIPIDKNQDMLVKQTLAGEIDRLGILNDNLRREIEDLRLQTVDNQSIKSRYEQLMATFVIMAVQIETLRQR